jgi:hypothetical protein
MQISVDVIMKSELILNRLNVVIGTDTNLHDTLCNAWKNEVSRTYEYPENFNHPHIQCKKMEEIVRDLNLQGGSALLLTNSSYMVDHLENLMSAFYIKHQKDIVDKFILKDNNSFIHPDNVSIFLCEYGEIKNGRVECEILWETFSNVAEWCSDLHYTIIGNWYK